MLLSKRFYKLNLKKNLCFELKKKVVVADLLNAICLLL